MKKFKGYFWLYLIIGIIVLSIIGELVYYNYGKIKLNTDFSSNCKNEVKLYYSDDKNDYYTDCIDSIKYKDQELKDAFSKNIITIDDILNKRKVDYYRSFSKRYHVNDLYVYYCYNLTDKKDRYIFINKKTFNENYDYCK